MQHIFYCIFIILSLKNNINIIGNTLNIGTFSYFCTKGMPLLVLILSQEKDFIQPHSGNKLSFQLLVHLLDFSNKWEINIIQNISTGKVSLIVSLNTCIYLYGIALEGGISCIF